MKHSTARHDYQVAACEAPENAIKTVWRRPVCSILRTIEDVYLGPRIATSNSNMSAVLPTSAAKVVSGSDTGRFWSASVCRRVPTCTELIDFAQDRFPRHGCIALFLQNLRRSERPRSRVWMNTRSHCWRCLSVHYCSLARNTFGVSNRQRNFVHDSELTRERFEPLIGCERGEKENQETIGRLQVHSSLLNIVLHD